MALALVAGLAVVLWMGPLKNAIREVTLPLRHDDIIRQQARDKDVDAALIAAVIYEESKFRDQTSRAGARGLMQITPRTADFIARRSGGTRFEQDDLAMPQINIAYGTYYSPMPRGITSASRAWSRSNTCSTTASEGGSSTTWK